MAWTENEARAWAQKHLKKPTAADVDRAKRIARERNWLIGEPERFVWEADATARTQSPDHPPPS
jgi:hypothetical protein